MALMCLALITPATLQGAVYL